MLPNPQIPSILRGSSACFTTYLSVERVRCHPMYHFFSKYIGNIFLFHVGDAGCHFRYLSLFCMYGLCTVPLLLSWMPGVILGICPYSVCMDSAQSHFSCPGCRCHSQYRYLSLFCMYGLCT
ncbi:unnamed protein product, partial [Staurois parvus]